MDQRTPRPRVEQYRKKQIREAALRCFIRGGFAQTRLLDIAREAGLSKGGIYFHYKAKEDLFSELLHGCLDFMRAGEPSLEEAGDHLAEHLLRTVRHHVTQLGAHPEETKLFNLLGTLGAQEERYRSCLMDAIEPLREHYSEIIRRGRELKRFECNDHESVAVLIVATIRGLCSHAALDDQGRLPAAASDCAELILRLAQPQKSAASLSTPWQPPEPRTSN